MYGVFLFFFFFLSSFCYCLSFAPIAFRSYLQLLMKNHSLTYSKSLEFQCHNYIQKLILWRHFISIAIVISQVTYGWATALRAANYSPAPRSKPDLSKLRSHALSVWPPCTTVLIDEMHMAWVWFQRWSKRSLSAKISLHHWACTVTYFERFICGQPVFGSVAML